MNIKNDFKYVKINNFLNKYIILLNLKNNYSFTV